MYNVNEEGKFTMKFTMDSLWIHYENYRLKLVGKRSLTTKLSKPVNKPPNNVTSLSPQNGILWTC